MHKIISHPSKAKLKHNDNGLIVDLIHLLLFWQNKKTGEFVLSKTKIISHVIFILCALWGVTLSPPSFIAVVFFGLLFEIPVFLIGYAIHKFTNPYPVNPPKKVSKPKEMPKSKPVIPKPANDDVDVDVVSEYEEYKNQVLELQREYDLKDNHARELIEKRFAPPQLTHTKFMGVVDKSKALFAKQSDSTLTMINLASEYSPKIESEIQNRIGVLKNISSKLDDLTNELVITMSEGNDDDIHNLFDEMSDLVKSVKDYE